ncbi:hypothetical protein DFA_10718 [Cavenderia fasciculata]|uniref:EGF-like domain-containing protein n=1 Tax=Cavenderia fasciculata TaxID=261658 RepID=F4QB73_CACFS|nr:uncharacterized protein DFA_10718 [Cavenderia fasciculata]EGG14845.1 hypothetical protein DFA_10718 [Cavenderia fasciculata]|eukprot:XP_004351361.1 hypothetical protein DFA_10718 [Cavenderia fasciculata]
MGDSSSLSLESYQNGPNSCTIQINVLIQFTSKSSIDWQTGIKSIYGGDVKPLIDGGELVSWDNSTLEQLWTIRNYQVPLSGSLPTSKYQINSNNQPIQSFTYYCKKITLPLSLNEYFNFQYNIDQNEIQVYVNISYQSPGFGRNDYVGNQSTCLFQQFIPCQLHPVIIEKGQVQRGLFKLIVPVGDNMMVGGVSLTADILRFTLSDTISNLTITLPKLFYSNDNGNINCIGYNDTNSMNGIISSRNNPNIMCLIQRNQTSILLPSSSSSGQTNKVKMTRVQGSQLNGFYLFDSKLSNGVTNITITSLLTSSIPNQSFLFKNNFNNPFNLIITKNQSNIDWNNTMITIQSNQNSLFLPSSYIQVLTGTSGNQSPRLSLPINYPFGLKSKTDSSIQLPLPFVNSNGYRINYNSSILSSTSSNPFLLFSSSLNNNQNQLEYDNLAPKLNNIIVDLIDYNTISIRLFVSDDISGVEKINVNDWKVLTLSDIKLGSPKSALFTSIINIGNNNNNNNNNQLQSTSSNRLPIGFIEVFDKAGNSKRYFENDIIGTKFIKIRRLLPNQLQLEDLKLFEFKPSSIDSNNLDNSVELTFGLKNDSMIDKNWKPWIKCSFSPFSKPVLFQGAWVESLGLYKIIIDIPRGILSGKLVYHFLYDWIDHDLIDLTFEKSLTIINEQGDIIGPIVHFMNIANDNNQKIIFSFTIQDMFGNGFMSKKNVSDGNSYYGGYFELGVMSTRDPIPFNFTLYSVPASQIINSANSTMVNINCTILYNNSASTPTTCQPQTYQVSYLKLCDDGNNCNTFDLYGDSYPYNPFKSFSNGIPPNLPVTCPVTPPSNSSSNPNSNSSSPPILKSFEYRQSKTNPFEMMFSLEIIDTSGSGLSPRHSPFIYLISNTWELFSIQIPINNNNSNNVNNDTIIVGNGLKTSGLIQFNNTIPFGGQQQVLMSIYGLTDNNLNTRGYDSSELSSLFDVNSMLSLLGPASSESLPTISSITPVDAKGGVTTIKGLNLQDYSNQTNTKIYLNCMDSTPIQQPTILGLFIIGGNNTNQTTNDDEEIMVIAKIESPISSQRCLCNIQVFDQLSNPLILSPINFIPSSPPCQLASLYPTNNSSSSSSNSSSLYPIQCSNQGKCDNEIGCKCNVGTFTGADCSFLPLIEFPPIASIKSPSVGFKTNQSQADISIIELRELSFDNNSIIVNSYQLDWKLIYNQSSSLIYTSVLPNQLKTTLNVTIDFLGYVKSGNNNNNQYGGNNINTVKYTINMTSYTFDSPLNPLQLIMLASIGNVINGNDQEERDACLTKLIGYSNNKQVYDMTWLQIGVNDQALYSRFIHNATIDGDRPVIVSNTLVDFNVSAGSDNNNKKKSTFKIGITVPYYRQSISIDPTFQMIVDPNYNTRQSKGGSKRGENSLDQIYKCLNMTQRWEGPIDEPPLLSQNLLIGFIVAVILFGLVTTTLVVLLIKYKYHVKLFLIKSKIIKD